MPLFTSVKLTDSSSSELNAGGWRERCVCVKEREREGGGGWERIDG